MYNHVMAENLTFPADINIGEFVSKEAHDLKSPFNRIMGFMKLVMKGMDGPISDQAKEDLTTAFQNTQYAMYMMNGLVEMARLSRGERNITLGPCQVSDLLHQTITDWKKQYPQDKAVEVTVSAPDCAIRADEMSLRVGLSYWISYVIEFAPQNTAVNIYVEEQPKTCLFTIRSIGQKTQPPPECDLTMYGYIAREILALHQGILYCAEEKEDGALIQFSIAKAFPQE